MSARALLALSLAVPCGACGAQGTSSDELSTQLRASEALCLETAAQEAQNAADLDAIWLQRNDAPVVSSIASDTRGNVVIARSDSETAKLTASGQTLWTKPFGRLVATGADDHIYVASAHAVQRLDPEGNELSTIELGDEASIESIAATTDGALVVSGPGLGTLKLDASGQRLWERPFFGKIAVDGAGAVVVAGALSVATDFGAGPVTSHGGDDVFVTKLDADGGHVFSRVFGDAASQQRAESVALDADGNIVIAGVFDGALDFESGALALRPDACSSDAWCNTFGFVAKLDELGTASWSRDLGPMRAIPSAAADSQGGVVLSGALPGGVRPFRNTWLGGFDAGGSATWRRAEWPETGIGAGHAVALDACDNVLWSVSARPSLESEERAYLAKLSP